MTSLALTHKLGIVKPNKLKIDGAGAETLKRGKKEKN